MQKIVGNGPARRRRTRALEDCRSLGSVVRGISARFKAASSRPLAGRCSGAKHGAKPSQRDRRRYRYWPIYIFTEAGRSATAA